MKNNNTDSRVSRNFIALMAILMSFIAFAIDSMIPALDKIGRDLNVQNPNDVQLVISTLFLGMCFGLLFFGPFSDSFGRKPAVYLGMFIFMAGCTISIFATTFEIMIAGRLLQGVGGSSLRVVTVAMVRDKFEGNAMAKVMSFIMIVFILIPAVAPLIGQMVLLFADWQAIFWLMLILGSLTLIWFALGQAETLPQNKRRIFSIKIITDGVVETVRNKISLGYTIATGFVFSAFIAYLSLAQQILQQQYRMGNKFVFAFGALALCIGFASYANTRWVDKYGIEGVCKRSLTVAVTLAIVFAVISLFYDWQPPTIIFLLFMSITFFCLGLLFANLNTLAMTPLGHIAGVANSVITSISLLISVPLGALIAYLYDGTLMSLGLGFLVLNFLTLIMVIRLARHSAAANQPKRSPA